MRITSPKLGLLRVVDYIALASALPSARTSALASAQTRAHARATTALQAPFLRASSPRRNRRSGRAMWPIDVSARLGRALVFVWKMVGDRSPCGGFAAVPAYRYACIHPAARLDSFP